MTKSKSLEHVAKTSGWHIEAYQFLSEGLQHTMRTRRGKDRRRRHVSASQLLDGLAEFATIKFGLLAPTVFNEWGIKGSEDLGEMIYQMIDLGIMRRSKNDHKEDFLEGPDFYTRLQDFGTKIFNSNFTDQD